MKQSDVAQWLMANDFTVEPRRFLSTLDGPASHIVIIRSASGEYPGPGPFTLSARAAGSVFRSYADTLEAAASADDDAKAT
jgi:hypothetical protein